MFYKLPKIKIRFIRIKFFSFAAKFRILNAQFKLFYIKNTLDFELNIKILTHTYIYIHGKEFSDS